MYRDRNKRVRRNLALASVLVVVLFAADALTGGLIRAPVRAIGASISGVADKVFYGIFESGIFASKVQLANENESLRQQVASLEGQLAHLSVIETENSELRQFMHLASTTAGIAAPVVSSFTASPYGTFLIGAGQESGIRRGALVLSPDGFVIGKVSDVQQTESLVTEIFAAGSSIDVQASGVPVTLSGQGGGNAFGEAPRGSQIATGTPVVAPSMGLRPVGLVERAEGDAMSAAVKVYVRTPANLLTLQLLYVENL